MGLFSFTCAKSGLSVANCGAGLPSKYSDCYLVTPSKVYHEPYYSGYGRFGGVDVYALLGDGDRIEGLNRVIDRTTPFEVKVVLAEHYNGESYEQLEPSKDCDFQGHFFSNEYLKSIGLDHLCAEEEEEEDWFNFEHEPV